MQRFGWVTPQGEGPDCSRPLVLSGSANCSHIHHGMIDTAHSSRRQHCCTNAQKTRTAFHDTSVPPTQLRFTVTSPLNIAFCTQGTLPMTPGPSEYTVSRVELWHQKDLGLHPGLPFGSLITQFLSLFLICKNIGSIKGMFSDRSQTTPCMEHNLKRHGTFGPHNTDNLLIATFRK